MMIMKFNHLKNTLKALLLISCWLVTSAGHASSCPANLEKLKPDNMYKDNLDGTITDKVTSLIWQKCIVGETYKAATGVCDGTPTAVHWGEAMESAKNNTDYGSSDWRMPNIKELASLAEGHCVSPSINTTIFGPTKHAATETAYYWSSTPTAGTKGNDNEWRSHIWALDFKTNVIGIHPKDRSFASNDDSAFYYARLVR